MSEESEQLTIYDTAGQELFTAPIASVHYDDNVAEVLTAARDAGVDTSHAKLPARAYYRVDFSGLNLRYADFTDGSFEYCDFSNCDVSHITFEPYAEFVGCEFYGANLAEVPQNVIFTRCEVDSNTVCPKWVSLPGGKITMYKAVRLRRSRFETPISADHPLYDQVWRDEFLAVLELEVPKSARRTGTFPTAQYGGQQRKCRVSRAKPVAVYTSTRQMLDVQEVFSPHYNSAPAYTIGKMYKADGFDLLPTEHCGQGINCFRTFEEAVAYFRYINN